MIRELAPDELVWFIRQSFAFAGHADPAGLALKLQGRLRQPSTETSATYALFRDGVSVAGVNLQDGTKGDAARRLTFTSPWHVGQPADLLGLLEELLDRHPHEVALLPLHLLPEQRCAELQAVLAPLGFRRQRQVHLRFELSEVPPLGSPLVLEAYREEDERHFRELYADSEGAAPSEARWAYLKRRGGPFSPNFWFVARETLDQEAVGYAFCSVAGRGIDANYSIDAVGVRRRFRGDSEMLRRMLLTLLHELSGASPLGAVDAVLPDDDPKLIQILGYLGFVTLERVPLLLKRPD